MAHAAQLRGGSGASVGDAAKFGVLTVSDRASSGVYEDLSGPAILGFFAEAVASPWEADYRVIPDEQPLIEAAIVDMVGSLGVAAAAGRNVWRRMHGPRCAGGAPAGRIARSTARRRVMPRRWTSRAAAWW